MRRSTRNWAATMTAVFAANAQPIVRVLTSEASRANAGKPASICP